MDEFESGDKGVAGPAPAAGDDGNSAPLPETVSAGYLLRLPLLNLNARGNLVSVEDSIA